MPNKELDLFKELIPALDGGMKQLYDACTDIGRKDIKGDLWNLNRYMSNVKGNRDKAELAVFKTNEYYNKNWAVLGDKHPKLQWYLLCQCGNTGKKEFHPWQGFKKKTSNNSAVKIIEQLNPNMKQDEVEMLASMYTKKELKQLIEDHELKGIKV